MNLKDGPRDQDIQFLFKETLGLHPVHEEALPSLQQSIVGMRLKEGMNGSTYSDWVRSDDWVNRFQLGAYVQRMPSWPFAEYFSFSAGDHELNQQGRISDYNAYPPKCSFLELLTRVQRH